MANGVPPLAYAGYALAPVVTLACGYENFLSRAVRVYDRCQWCNRVFRPGCQSRGPSRDHLIPRSLDGPNRVENLVAACRRCNHRRGDDPNYTGVPFFGPRWEYGGYLLRETAEPVVVGFCRLWVDEGPGWRPSCEGLLRACLSRREVMQAKPGMASARYLLTPRGVTIQPRHLGPLAQPVVESSS